MRRRTVSQLAFLFGVILLTTPLLKCANAAMADEEDEYEDVELDEGDDAPEFDEPEDEDEDEDEDYDDEDEDEDEEDDDEDYDDEEEDEDEEEDGDDEDAGDINVNDPDVVVLTDDNFSETVKKYAYALVEFYAPWCGHCQSLAPQWAKVATQLKTEMPDVLVAKVDATKQKKLADQFEIEGFPTIKFIIGGEDVVEFDGGRASEEIIQWVKKATGPATIEIKSADEIAVKELQGPIVVGYLSSLEGDIHTAFEKAAKKASDAAFLTTTDAAAAKSVGLTTKDTAALITTFKDRKVSVFDGKLDNVAELAAFVKLGSFPLIPVFSENTQKRIFEDNSMKHIFLLCGEACLQTDGDDVKSIYAVADKYKGKLMFVHVNTDSPSASPVLDYFGVKKSNEIQIVGFQMSSGKKFFYKENIQERPLDQFASDHVEGKLAAEVKSAPIPKEGEDMQSGVKVVVGKSFDDVVKDPTKDVLVEIYAPWCGHCKALAPTYIKLAKRFADIDSVVIAKMDGTKNEHPDAASEGFPTILFFPAEKDAEPISYEGDRSLIGLTKFIKEHAKVPYELTKKYVDGSAASSSSDVKDEL